MRRLFFVLTVIAGASVAAGVIHARVSGDPVGVYCVVSKVLMAPDEATPESIQVWGSCAFASGGMGPERPFSPSWYSNSQIAGYLYFKYPLGKQAVTVAEWMDFKRAAGTGDIVGFGGRGLNNGRMRWGDEKPIEPDVYPIREGVTRVATKQWAAGQPFYDYADLFGALRKSLNIR
jgi:hypothetical protein